MQQSSTYQHNLATVLVISLIYPLGPAAIILAPMIIGGVVDGLGFSEQQGGTLASIEGLGLVIASAAAAFWIRKIAWVKVLAICFLVLALLNVISAGLTDFTPLLITRFLTGFVGGSLFAVAVAALGDNNKPDRAFGIAQAVQGAMMFLAFAAAPYLLEHWSVGGLFYLLAAASLALLPVLAKFPNQGVSHPQQLEGSSSSQNNLLIFLGLIGGFIFFINVFGFWAFIERIGQAAELPAATIGLALGLSQIAAIAGALSAAAASDRFGRSLPLTLVMILNTVVLWLLVGKFTSVTFFIGAGIFQALFMIGTTYQLGAIAKIDIKGKFLVLMTAAQGLGAAVGPGVAAGLIYNGDYRLINLMAGSACVVSVLLFLFIIRRSRTITES